MRIRTIPLFIDELKLRAAAGSLQQFLPVVRSIFPDEVDDVTLEAATVYLYIGVTREVFGRRFSDFLRRDLRARLRFASATEIGLRAGHLHTRVKELADEVVEELPPDWRNDSYRTHALAVIGALLESSQAVTDDPKTIQSCFAAYERSVGSIRDHLLGIKTQNHFVMR